MARRTKKFHRKKSDKLSRAIRARRKVAQQGLTQARVSSRSLLPIVNLNG